MDTLIISLTGSPVGNETLTVNLSGIYDQAGNGPINVSGDVSLHDIHPFTITITSTDISSGDITDDSSINLTFICDEETNDFSANHITVSNQGTISNFSGSGTHYTATLEPFTTGEYITYAIQVKGGEFLGQGTTKNTASNIFNDSFS